jgi:chaperone required for assembly of F1-ATPase
MDRFFFCRITLLHGFQNQGPSIYVHGWIDVSYTLRNPLGLAEWDKKTGISSDFIFSVAKLHNSIVSEEKSWIASKMDLWEQYYSNIIS